VTAGRVGNGSLNEYSLHYLLDLDACVATATLARVGSDTPAAGRITVSHEAGDVIVRTFDASGAATTQPFNVIVTC
jgi:hypothetical protein